MLGRLPFYKKLTTKWKERSDWPFKSAVEKIDQLEDDSQRCLQELPPGSEKQKSEIERVFLLLVHTTAKV